MIQFNLLPDVKLEYLRTQRLKRLVIATATLVSGVALLLFVIMFILVNIVQKTQINSLKKDIKANSSKIAAVTDINKILTVQNQLTSLPTLHQQKPVTTRLFTFITQFTPVQATINKLSIGFDTSHIEMTGNADTLATVNQFVDTLKFTMYHTSDSNDQKPAFKTVVLNTFNVDTKTGASYNIGLDFDPLLFDSHTNVILDVPKDKITTRSETERPLFSEPAKTDTGKK
jgi:hypothetical protein